MSKKEEVIAKYVVARWKQSVCLILNLCAYLILTALCLYILVRLEGVFPEIVRSPKLGLGMLSSGREGNFLFYALFFGSFLLPIYLSYKFKDIFNAGYAEWVFGIRFFDEFGKIIRSEHRYKLRSYKAVVFMVFVASIMVVSGYPLIILSILVCYFLIFKKDVTGRIPIFSHSKVVPIHKKDIENFYIDILKDS